MSSNILNIIARKHLISRLISLADENLLAPKEIRDAIAIIYKRFMEQCSGSTVADLKTTFKLPYLDEVGAIFSVLVNNIDTWDVEKVNKVGNEIIVFIEKARVHLNNLIKTNTSDPAYTAFHSRKQVASTVEKALEAIQFLLSRQLKLLKKDVKSVVELEKTPDISKRRRMTQTPDQTQAFILEYGPRYGINSMEDWGNLVHSDYDKAYELMTKFLGHRREKKHKVESSHLLDQLLKGTI